MSLDRRKRQDKPSLASSTVWGTTTPKDSRGPGLVNLNQNGLVRHKKTGIAPHAYVFDLAPRLICLRHVTQNPDKTVDTLAAGRLAICMAILAAALSALAQLD